MVQLNNSGNYVLWMVFRKHKNEFVGDFYVLD